MRVHVLLAILSATPTAYCLFIPLLAYFSNEKPKNATFFCSRCALLSIDRNFCASIYHTWNCSRLSYLTHTYTCIYIYSVEWVVLSNILQRLLAFQKSLNIWRFRCCCLWRAVITTTETKSFFFKNRIYSLTEQLYGSTKNFFIPYSLTFRKSRIRCPLSVTGIRPTVDPTQNASHRESAI